KRPDITQDLPDYYSLIMQACWSRDPELRPKSRELETTFVGLTEKIMNGQLICPKKLETTNAISNYPFKNSSSQILPSLSIEQLKYLEEMDERSEALYQNSINQRLLEINLIMEVT
ncbi:15761_t:CDS:2, partial [Funneliformis mosseae]